MVQESKLVEKALLVTFTVGREKYALSYDTVSEVIEAGHIESIPKSPPEIEGIYNHRGKILTIVNFDSFSGEAAPRKGAASIIILSRSFSHIGFLTRCTVRVERANISRRGTLHPSHKLYDILAPPVLDNGNAYNVVSPEKIIQYLSEEVIGSRLITV